MTTLKNIYTWVCIVDVLVLLALGVMLATGVTERLWDMAFPDPDAAMPFLSLSMSWKQIAITLLFFGCPASVVVLWLGYLMFVWDGK